MPEWVPVSTSSRGRLAAAALSAFGADAFDEVAVVDLASSANTTTGSLYHHFGSKLGLYGFVREDVERRVLDRMQGAAAAAEGSGGARVSAALLVAFDYAVESGFAAKCWPPPSPAGRRILSRPSSHPSCATVTPPTAMFWWPRGVPPLSS